MAFWKESMINRLSNLINRNRSAAKISQVLCSSKNTFKSAKNVTLKSIIWRSAPYFLLPFKTAKVAFEIIQMKTTLVLFGRVFGDFLLTSLTGIDPILRV